MSNHKTPIKLTDTKALLLFTLWSFIFQLFLSNDSPFYGLAHHWDSAWFFMEGKAFIIGMRPYVEFSDFKGPLIWLIYGIGYLISPHNYLGMYVVAGVLYALTLFFNYKTVRIFLQSDKQSVAATLPMMFAYFFPWFHFETRSEDLMLPFVAITLYVLFKRLYAEKRNDPADFMMLGGCFTALVLMKYNIAAGQGVAVLIALWDQYKNKRGLAQAFGWMIFIAVLISAPFIIYFIMTDTLHAFFNNYFMQAYETVTNVDNGSLTLWENLDLILRSGKRLSFIGVVFLSGLHLGLRQKRYKYVPVVIALLFFAITSYHNIWHYYYSICYIFILYLFIDVLLIYNKRARRVSYLLLTVFISVACLYGNLITGELRQNSIFTNNDDHKVFQEISDVMKDVKNPKVLDYEGPELGFGLMYDPIPAGEQFAYPNGGTPPMLENHKQILIDRKADFVITLFDKDKPQTLQLIEANGYELRLKRVYMERTFYIYEKKK